MKEISEEVYDIAKTLYDDDIIQYTIDRNGKALIDSEHIPDIEDYIYYYGEAEENDFNTALYVIASALDKVKFYDGYLELNDNYTLWDINAPEDDMLFDEDAYSFIVTTSLQDFRAETDTDLYLLGRMGRHAVVDNNFSNLMRYDELKQVQQKYEQEVINQAQETCFYKEDITEGLAKGEEVTRCQECGSSIIYKKIDLQEDLEGKYIKCPNCSSYVDLIQTDRDVKTENKKVMNESSNSVGKAKALLDIFNEVYDGMGDMYAEDEWAEILANNYNIDDADMEPEEVILTALNKMSDSDFRSEVDGFIDGLIANGDIDYLKDTLHIYPRNFKHIVDCFNSIKPYASVPDKIDEIIAELQSVNMNLRITAEEFQEYLHHNYEPWKVLGTTTGPRTYTNLFTVPTEYDIVGADYFNYADRPSDMLDNIGYGWKQDGDKIVADLIGFAHGVKGSSVIYDKAPVKYGYSAIIDSSNKEEKFKEMANALISKAKEIKDEYKLGESKVVESANKEITEYRLSNKKDNPVWITGYVVCNRKVYDVSAKVFIEGSEFGIDEGPISKLWIKNRRAYKPMCNYDRGWDVKPDAKNQDTYKAICDLLIDYRNKNPYVTTEDE